MSEHHTYAIFSAQYPPHTGGVERFTERLARQLAEQGDRIFVITSKLDDSPACETLDNGVEVYRLPAYVFMNGRLPISRKNAAYRHMLDELAVAGVDRVLVNTRFYRHSLEGLRFARRIGVPVIVLDHGSAHLTLTGGLVDRIIERYEHMMTERGKRFAPAYAGISHASVEWLRHFDIDTPFVIPNAIDVGAFKDQAVARDFREELSCGADRKLVAFVGRLEPEKGALVFAQAARELGSEYVCVMAGEGSQRSIIEALALDTVHLLGNVGQQTLSALLRDADVFCLPTRSEGFCTSLLEASAQGAIPVMPRVGGTDEVMSFPPRFGVLLEDDDPSDVADAVRRAALLGGQADDLSAFVTSACSWPVTTQALDAAFSAIVR